MSHSNLDRVIDTLLVMRPASAAAITTATTTTEAEIIDLGPGYHRFDVFVDVTALDVDTGDERVLVEIYGSAVVGMTNPELLGVLVLGDATGINLTFGTTTSDRALGEYVLPCHNIAKVSGVDTPMRFIRMSTTTIGTFTSVDFVAWATKRT
jgi:hypothetical protein